MSDSGEVTEDRGFKELFIAYPVATLELFAPELLAAHGPPVRVEAVQQEFPFPDLRIPARFLDVALLCTWSDGSQDVVLLVEHWSDVRKVLPNRVLFYYAGLRLRHGCEVWPVILVTDPSETAVPDVLTSDIGGVRVLEFRMRVVRITPEDLPRLRALQSRVAAVLMAFALRQLMTDLAKCAALAFAAFQRAPGPVEDLQRFLPLIFKAARMPETDEPRFREHLREEPDMVNFIEEIEAKGKAEGEAVGIAKGKAEGTIEEIRRLVKRGRMTIDAAKAEIADLMASGEIPEAIGQDALARLG